MNKKLSEIVGDYSMSGTRRMQAPGNLRAGVPVRGDRQPHLDPSTPTEVEKREQLPKVAVVYVKKGNKVLAVSKGTDLRNMNMPAGLVENGEDPQEAAIRELWEETGLRAREIHPLFTKKYDGKLVSAFRVLSYTGDLKNSYEGVSSWQDPEMLLQGQYGDFFEELLKKSKV